jgi:hypothetical protein
MSRRNTSEIRKFHGGLPISPALKHRLRVDGSIDAADGAERYPGLEIAR